jgi:aryl-alcohol dehydrogenase-like predicted oxidoreductase
MRYRSLGATGTVISAVSLALNDVPGRRRMEDWRDLIYQALESGVNAFEIVGLNPAIAEGLGEGLRSVERHLVFVALRLGQTPKGRDFSPAFLARSTESIIARTGLGFLDLCLLDDPGEDELPADSLAILKALRAAGRTKMIGVRGQGTALDAYISTGAFDALAMPYSLAAGWLDRHRLKAAAEQNMAVLGYDFWPERFREPERKTMQTAAKRTLWSKVVKPAEYVSPISGAGTYAFLHETPGWTAEDICLAYALTEPAIASLQIPTESADRLAELASISEREMPNGVASRIEMARFTGQKAATA